MTVDDIIKYIMSTPNNSNPAVLKSILGTLGEEADKEQEMEHEVKDLIQRTMTDPFIDETATSVGEYAFYRLNLNSMTLENVTTVAATSFNSAAIDTLSLPNITDIPENAFNSSQISNFYLPKVETIRGNAFRHCTAMKSLWLPISCTSIITSNMSDGVFSGATSMQKIYCEAPSKPSGWGWYWNYDALNSRYMTAEWNVSYEEYLEKIKTEIS